MRQPSISRVTVIQLQTPIQNCLLYHHPIAYLDEHDLVPFKGAIEAGVSSIMTAHVAFPALDPTGAPATSSHPILTDLAS